MENQFSEALEKGKQIYEHLKEVLEDFRNWRCPISMRDKDDSPYAFELAEKICRQECIFRIPIPEYENDNLCFLMTAIQEGIADAEVEEEL